MNKNTIYLLALLVLAGLLGWWLVRRYGKKTAVDPTTGSACIKVNATKFPVRWLDDRIPHGDLGAIAQKYLTPAIGGDPNYNGSLVGGFFKGINTYPSMDSARYYQRELLAWAKTEQALPYWNMVQGEMACPLTQS